MNVPARRPDAEEPKVGKWETIRYAIDGWGTTFRLLVILLVLSAPVCVLLLLGHVFNWMGHL